MAGFLATDANCVFAFEFEDNATDLTGNGYNGTLAGGAGYETGGISNRRLTLDGTDDKVTIADSVNLDNMTALTISAWIRTTTSDSNNCLISKRDSWGATSIPYEINIANGTAVNFRVIGNNSLDVTGVLTLDTLHHLACTWDGTIAKIYVDGVEKASGTRSGTLTANARDVVIGELPGGGENYGGKIDRLFLFNVAKTALQIQGEAAYVLTVEQEGYRFRADDGTESAASWLASQDTNITRTRSINTRLRMLLNTTDKVSSSPFQLEYKLSSDSVYAKIAPDNYVEIVNESMVATPSTGTMAGNATYDGANSAVRFTTATNSESGQFHYSATLATTFTTEFDIFAGGGTGADAIWFFFASTSLVGAEDAASGGYAIAYSEFHDQIRIFWNGTLLSSTALANLDNSTWRTAKIVVTGSNIKAYSDNVLIVDFTDSTRTLTGTIYGWGGRCGGSNNIHRSKNILLYEGNKPGSITLASSTNIAASGAATTVQLTAPSGKTTSDFVVGRIQDDENPADTIDILVDDYTELEWCLKAQTTALDNNIYYFRVTINGTALSTYTLTPQWTIGTAGAVAKRLMLLGVG